MTKPTIRLINDETLARILDISVYWVRNQEKLRRKGQEHSLDIDPIYIGKSKRYRLSDIEAWIQRNMKEAPQCS